MLFTDGPPSSIQDLAAQDSQLLTVASIEGIDVSAKLALAHQELALDLRSMLERQRYADQSWAFWLEPPARLHGVVVTPTLKNWHTFHSLEMVYRDAYYNQLNDRYAAKRDAFAGLARNAREQLIALGLGMTPNPVPQAVSPNASSGLGGALAAGTYYVTATWLNAFGEEGAAATPAAVTLAGVGNLVVQAVNPPAAANGWNAYIGAAPDAMTLQNTAPIPADQPWVQSNPLSSSGAAPGSGQKPGYHRPIPRVTGRG